MTSHSPRRTLALFAAAFIAVSGASGAFATVLFGPSGGWDFDLDFGAYQGDSGTSNDQGSGTSGQTGGTGPTAGGTSSQTGSDSGNGEICYHADHKPCPSGKEAKPVSDQLNVCDGTNAQGQSYKGIRATCVDAGSDVTCRQDDGSQLGDNEERICNNQGCLICSQNSSDTSSSTTNQSQSSYHLSAPQALNVTVIQDNTYLLTSQQYINNGVIALHGAEVNGVDQGHNVVIIDTTTYPYRISVIQKPELLEGERVGYAKGVSNQFWTEPTGRYYGWLAETEISGFAFKGYYIVYDRLTDTWTRDTPHMMYTAAVEHGPFLHAYCMGISGISCPYKVGSVGDFDIQVREDDCSDLSAYIYRLNYLPFIQNVTSYVNSCWAVTSTHHTVVKKDDATVVGDVYPLPPFYALLGDENHQQVSYRAIAPVLLDNNVLVYGKQQSPSNSDPGWKKYPLFLRTIEQ